MYAIIKKCMIICIIFICMNCNSNNSRNFSFTYSVELEPSKNKKLELWIPFPQSNSVQTISSINIDTEGLEYEIKDEFEHGNKYLYVYSKCGIEDSKRITLRFNVNRIEHKNIYPHNINKDKYLNPSSMIPVGSIFNEIIDENNLTRNNIRGIYDFVLSGMHYGKPKSIEDQYYKEPWLSADESYGLKKVSRDDVVILYENAKKTDGAYTFGNGNSLYACDIGVGNCTDYHSYFMSLSRTLRIPSRFHMGFSIPNNDFGQVSGYHCWADFYKEGKGWYPVDISEADKDPSRIDYFFGTLCNNRVEMIIGRDFILEEYEKTPINLFIYPLLEIDDKISTRFTKSFSYSRL